MKKDRNIYMSSITGGPEPRRRDSGRGWLDRRFARRLFSMLMVVSLLLNTFGFMGADAWTRQNRLMSAEAIDFDLESDGFDTDDKADGLELDDGLVDLTVGDLDKADLSISQNLASNTASGDNTYVYQLTGQTRLLLSDLVEELALPVKEMKFVQNVSLLGNEQDPTIDMSLFVSVVAMDEDFLFYIKPLFAEARLNVYTDTGMFTLRLVNDPNLTLEEVRLAALELSENPSAFEPLFSYDFDYEPAAIRLSRVLEAVGLSIKGKNVEEVGVVEQTGDEGNILDIEAVKDDYKLTAKRSFSEIELAVFTANDIYTISLLNGRAVGSGEGAEGQEQTEVGVSAPGDSEERDIDLAHESSVDVSGAPGLDLGDNTGAGIEIEQIQEPVSEPVVEQPQTPATEPGTEPGTESGGESAIEQIQQPASEPETEPGSEPGTEPGSESAIEQIQQPASEPENEPETEPASEPGDEQGEDQSITVPEAEPVAEPATEPGIESGTESAIEQIQQPVSEPENEQVETPASEPGEQGEDQTITEPTEPGDEPGEEQPITVPEVEPGTEPATEPGTESGSESAIEQIQQPVSEPEIEQVETPASEPGDEPSEDQSITVPETEPITEPTEPGDEQGENQSITVPEAEPITEPTEPGDEPSEDQSITVPEAEPGTEPTEPGDESSEDQSITVPETEPGTEPTEPGDEQGEDQTTTEPTEDQEGEPETEPATEPETGSTEPGDEQDGDQSITEPATEPVEEPSTEPTEDQEGEPATEPETEPTEPGDEPGEDQSITEPGTEPAEEPATEPEEAPVAYPAVTFSARASGVTVDVTADEGAFPEGTTMTVRRVWDADTLSDIRESVADDFTRVRRVQAVDIAFYNIDGVEIEPLIPISVVISVSEINDGQSAMVVHMDDEGQTEVVTQSDAGSADGKTNLNMEMPAGEGAQTEVGEDAAPDSDGTMPAVGDGVDASQPSPDASAEAGEGGAADEAAPESDDTMPSIEDGVDVPDSDAMPALEDAAPASNQTEVSFEAGAFSLYAVVVTETIQTRYIDASGATYLVEVGYGKDAGIPTGAELVVSELTDEDAEAYFSAALEAVENDGNNGENDRNRSEKALKYAKALDISIVADGVKVEPKSPVEVSIKLLDAPEIDEKTDVSVVHFGAEVETIESTVKGESVGFETDGFSVYVVTYTLSTYYMDANGQTFNIEVAYDREADIPEGAELRVSEITGDDAEDYVARAAEALNVSDSQMTYAKALDIAIVKDGEEYTPATPVSVSIRLLDAPEADENTNIEVVHFGDEPEALECALNGENVEFEADGFSVYVVAYTVDFHWGDFTYNLAGGSEIFLSELIDILGIEDFALEDVADVAFSDPSLVQVDAVEIMDAGPELIETDDTEELIEHTHADWRLWSLAPFDTEETLTVMLNSGETVEVRVTDIRYGDDAGETVTLANGRRVTADGVTYTLSNAGTADGTADVYAISANCNIHDVIVYKGYDYTVRDIYQSAGNLTGKRSTMDWDVVKKAAVGINDENSDFEFFLPTIILPEDAASIVDVDETYEAMDSSDLTYKLWKKSEYKPESNTIEYNLKYFQAMNPNTHLDFIFVYDDSASMYSGIRESHGIYLREAQATRVLIQAAARMLFSVGAADHYDNQVYLAGASTGDTSRSEALTSYDAVTAYLATYHTGTTRHATGVANALTLARASIGAGRQPVVVYLSDFHQPGTLGNAGISDAKTLHNMGVPVYGLSTDLTPSGNAAYYIPTSTSKPYLRTMTTLDEGVIALKDIILDAIGYYMKGDITVSDPLPEALQDVTPDDTTATGNGALTPAVGGVTWSLGDQNPYLGAGKAYTSTFTVALNDGTVYAGSMPTNGVATLTVDGREIGSITPSDDTPDKLHLAGGVTFVLARMDEKNKIQANADTGAPNAGTLVSGISFTLYKEGQAIGTYTTDVDGAFTIPFKSGDQVVLERGETYELREGDVSAYNADNDPKLIAPDSYWTITVDENGVVTTAVAGTPGQTPGTTVEKAVAADPEAQPPVAGHSARYVLWNQIEVKAQLIPITVQKTWPEDAPRKDPVPFTIYGVYQGGTGSSHEAGEREALIAYADKTTSSTQVKYLTSDNSTVSTVDGKTVWTKTVYVPDFTDPSDKFFDYTDVINLTGLDPTHTFKIDGDEYTVADLEQYADKDGKIFLGGTYSYAIDEGDLVYDDGWYEAEFGENQTATNIKEGWTETTTVAAHWDSLPGSQNQEGGWFYGQIHMNLTGFTLKQTGLQRQSDYKTKSNLYKYVRTVEVTVNDNYANTDTTLRFDISFTNYDNGQLLQYIKMPYEWSTYGYILDILGLGGHNINNLLITKMVFIDDMGDRIDIVGGVNTWSNGYGPARNSSSNLVLAVEENGANRLGHQQTPIQSDTTQIYVPEYTTSSQHDNTYTINSCTLTISNTWMPNPLIPVKVVKQWVNGETGEALDMPYNDEEEQIITFSLTGTTTRGGTKILPIFASSDAAWSAKQERGTLTGSKTSPTWETTVYVPAYDTSTYDRTQSPACEAYDFAGGSHLKEYPEALAVATADGSDKGEWAEPTVVYSVGQAGTASTHIDAGWYDLEYDSTTEGYIVFGIQRPNDNVTDFAVGGVRIEYTGTDGAKYRIALPFDKVYNMKYAEYAYPGKTIYVSFQWPSNLPGGTITKMEVIKYDGKWWTMSETTGVKYFAIALQPGTAQVRDSSGNIAQVTNPVYEYWREAEDIEGSPSSVPTFTITNAFIPYKAVTLSSIFVDETADSASTNDNIAAVVYTIRQGDDVVRTVEGDSDDGFTKTVFLKNGEYTVEQTGLKLVGDDTVYPFAAYDAAYTLGNEPGAGAAYTGMINADCVIAFTDTRKVLPATVQTRFLPELSDGERPLGSDRSITYELSYYSVNQSQDVSSITGTLADSSFDDDDNNYRNVHANAGSENMPAYSVRGDATQCLVSDENLAAALPDYEAEILYEETEGAVVFTINAQLKRRGVYLNKTWYDESHTSGLTFELTRSDGAPFYGLVTGVSDDGTPVFADDTVKLTAEMRDGDWSAAFEDVPAIRESERGSVSYVLKEIDADDDYNTTYESELATLILTQDEESEQASFVLAGEDALITVHNKYWKETHVAVHVVTAEYDANNQRSLVLHDSYINNVAAENGFIVVHENATEPYTIQAMDPDYRTANHYELGAIVVGAALTDAATEGDALALDTASSFRLSAESEGMTGLKSFRTGVRYNMADPSLDTSGTALGDDELFFIYYEKKLDLPVFYVEGDNTGAFTAIASENLTPAGITTLSLTSTGLTNDNWLLLNALGALPNACFEGIEGTYAPVYLAIGPAGASGASAMLATAGADGTEEIYLSRQFEGVHYDDEELVFYASEGHAYNPGSLADQQLAVYVIYGRPITLTIEKRWYEGKDDTNVVRIEAPDASNAQAVFAVHKMQAAAEGGGGGEGNTGDILLTFYQYNETTEIGHLNVSEGDTVSLTCKTNLPNNSIQVDRKKKDWDGDGYTYKAWAGGSIQTNDTGNGSWTMTIQGSDVYTVDGNREIKLKIGVNGVTFEGTPVLAMGGSSSSSTPSGPTEVTVDGWPMEFTLDRQTGWTKTISSLPTNGEGVTYSYWVEEKSSTPSEYALDSNRTSTVGISAETALTANGRVMFGNRRKVAQFHVVKSWVDENGNAIGANDARIVNKKITFEIYQVPKNTYVPDTHGVDIPVGTIVPETAWPAEEIASADQGDSIEITPSNGFFYYENNGTGHFYIIFRTQSQNANQLGNGPASAIITDSSMGVEYSGNYINFDASINEETHTSTDPHCVYVLNGENPYWTLIGVGTGDVVRYNRKYYAVWNAICGNPIEQWQDGTPQNLNGANWYSFDGNIGSIAGSVDLSQVTYDYTTQDAAEHVNELIQEQIDQAYEDAGLDPDDAPQVTKYIDANGNSEFILAHQNQGSSALWTKDFTMDTGYEYYVVETGYVGENAYVDPTYAFSQTNQTATVTNTYASNPAYIKLNNKSSKDYYFKLVIQGGEYGDLVGDRGNGNQSPEEFTGEEGARYYSRKVKANNSLTLYLPFAENKSFAVELYKDEDLTQRVAVLLDEDVMVASDSVVFNDAAEGFTGTLIGGPKYQIVDGGELKYAFGKQPNGSNITYSNYDKNDSRNCYNLAAANDAITIVHIVDYAADISLLKQDDQGSGLSGAVFALYTNEECTEPVTAGEANVTATSNTTGLATFDMVTAGTYYMREAQSPSILQNGSPTAFVENEDAYQVKLSKGVVTISAYDGGAEQWTELDKDDDLHVVVNIPAICKIVHGGVERRFATLNDAVGYAYDKLNGTATIQMLVDYAMPASDAVTLETGNDITLTTAPTQDELQAGEVYYYMGSAADNHAVITRDAEYGSMFTVDAAALTVEKITLDGNRDNYASASDGGLISVTNSGALTIRDGATLRDSLLRTGDTSAHYGGAVNAVNNSAVTMTGGMITGCESNTYGGGIYISGGTLSLSGSATISNCASLHGGGIYENGATTTIDDANNQHVTISDCTATGCGGGIYFHGGTADISGSTEFSGCKGGWNGTACIDDGTGGKGGAIDNGSGCGTVTISGNVQITNCSAYAGGGVYTEANWENQEFADGATTNISGSVTISDCTAASKGGGLYVEGYSANDHGTLNMSGGTVTRCSADESGSALFVDEHAIAGISGGSITGNIVSATCGAVEVEGGDARLNFSGNPEIYDNTFGDQQKNVVLADNSYAIINTTSDGLGPNAHIGVYVAGSNTEDPYKSHGMIKKDFGTIGVDGNNRGNSYLYNFTNDRNGMHGVECELTTDGHNHDNIIRWESYLCKLTGADGKLLYERLEISGENEGDPSTYKYIPAVYDRLVTLNSEKGGFSMAQGAVYSRSGNTYSAYSTTSAINVEMLKSYEQPANDVVTMENTTRAVTLKTAFTASTADDVYAYIPGVFSDDEDARAIIKRKTGNGSSMFTVNSGATFATGGDRGIILDGGATFDATTYAYKSGAVTVNGGIITVAANGTLTVDEGSRFQKSAVGDKNNLNYGGAIFVAYNGNFNVTGKESNVVEFEECTSWYGGGAVDMAESNSYAKTVSIKYSTFMHCTARGSKDQLAGGGAVRSLANSLTLEHCSFDQCSSTEQGGGLFHKGGTNFEAQYCQFTNCSAGSSNKAAGAMESQAPSVTINGCTFTNCTSSSNAGAVNFYRDNNAAIDGTISNSKFTNCNAKTDSALSEETATKGKGFGGAMRSYGTGKITIENCTFDNCNASWGGAVACFGSVEIKGTTSIRNCTAKKGGAVYLKDKTLEISGNTTDASEGKVTDESGELIKDENNEPVYMIMNCHASIDGGGIYHKKGTCNFNGGTIYNCYAATSGGGIYLGSDTNNELYLKGGSVSECYALTTGGGIYLGGGKTFSLTGESAVTDCCAPSGGGIYINTSLTNPVEITKNGDAITGCKAVTVTINNTTGEPEPADTSVNGQQGGGIYQAGGTIKIKKAKIKTCNAYDGGGIYLNGTSTLYLGESGKTEGATVMGCETTHNGAGIYQAGGKLYIYNQSSVSSNTASGGDGGGIYLGSGEMTIDNNVAIKGNKAEANTSGSSPVGGNGGGIYLGKPTSGNSTLTLNGSVGGTGTNDGNSAVNGGGIYQAGGTLTINSTANIISNKATSGNGGGIYLGGGTMTINSGAQVKGNSATGGNGGGIYLGGSGGKLYLYSSIGGTGKDDGNSAKNGGGIYQADGTMTIGSGVDVVGNTANNGNGGGIDLGGGTMTIGSNVDILNNTANNGNGGGVNLGGGTMTISSGATIKGNEATATAPYANDGKAGNGGGIYLGAAEGVTSKLTLNGEIGGTGDNDGNKAVNGGGIFQMGGTLEINGGNITGNVATAFQEEGGFGGGIYLGGGTFTLNDGVVGVANSGSDAVTYAQSEKGNKAVDGGGLYVADGVQVSILGGKISGNRVTGLGGGIATGGAESRLYFAGSIQVFDNFLPQEDGKDVRCDVCLDYDSNKIINTTAPGLNEESHIGVYVTNKDEDENGNPILDDDGDPTTLYEKHGKGGKPFGTFVQNGNQYASSLDRFINNRSGDRYDSYDYYYGVRKTTKDDPKIYWAEYICKITDGEGNLLFTNRRATAPALYQYLGKDGAFEALGKVQQFYVKTGENTTAEATPVYVKMLVDEYSLKWEDAVTWEEDGVDTIILTVADIDDPDYIGDRGEWDGGCVIKRGECKGPMFKTENSSTSFTLKNITLDGEGYDEETSSYIDDKAIQASGGLVNACGQLILDGATLKNAYVKDNKYNGGAVAFSGSGSLTMRNNSIEGGTVTFNEQTYTIAAKSYTAKIEHCKSANGAVLAVNAAGVNVTFVMDSSAQISNCEATNGLVYVKNGTLNLGTAGGNDCALNGNTDTTDTTRNVIGCTSTNGGVAYVAGGTLNLNGSIAHFSATNGGAVYVNSGTFIMEDVNATDDKIPSIKNCQAQLGGAIFAGNATVNLSAGEISGNVATGSGGGAIRLEDNNCKVNVSGTAVISGNKASDTGNGQRYGGAINIKKGTLTISGGTISGNYVETKGNGYGGAISAGDKLYITGGTISGNYVKSTDNAVNGGAISVDGANTVAEISGCTITGNYVQTMKANRDSRGGAIFVTNGATTTISGGTICANEAKDVSFKSLGGAIYVDDKSTVKISGAPDFGGTGTTENGELYYLESTTVSGKTIYRRCYDDEDGNTNYPDDFYYLIENGNVYLVDESAAYLNTHKETVDGVEVTVGDPVKGGIPIGNFVNKTGYGDKTNGGKAYSESRPATNPKTYFVRQDIYLAEASENDPKTLVVAGDLTGEKGSIWVWAESEHHYKQLTPFARLGDAFYDEGTLKEKYSENNGAALEAMLSVFRNAQDDEATENGTDTFLFGTSEGDISGLVYWTGVGGMRKVILRKVDGNYASVAGKMFNIYKGTSTTAYKPKGETDLLSGLTSGDSGCFWIGTLPYGWYILKEGETDPVRWFYLIVDDSGVYCTLDSSDKTVVGGYGTRAEAEAAAKAKAESIKAAKQSAA